MSATAVKLTVYPNTPVNSPKAVGVVTEVDFGEGLLDLLLNTYGVHDPAAAKGAAGYVVAAPVPGPRSNAAARPTQLVALDYDDAPAGPNWAALAPYQYVAYTTDSHDPDGAAGPRWRVWVLLDREYDAAEVAQAEVPAALEGCHLRAISQPVFLPTKADDVEWRLGDGDGAGARPLRLTEEWAPAAPAPGAPGGAGEWTPPGRRTAPSQAATNALVTRWLSRPEGTNRLAGATGACLAEWGWQDEDIRGYLGAWLSADPKLSKHTNDALRGAQKRRAGDRIVGFPTLASEGVDFVPEAKAQTDAEELWAAILAEPAEPAPADTDAPPAVGTVVWRWRTGTDIAVWNPPPIPWLSEELCLAPGAPGLITGYGGTGKTTFVQHLALCVVSGRKLLERYGVREGLVTHLDYEQGQDLTMRRYLDLGLTDLPQAAQERLRFASFPSTKLTDAEALAALLQAAKGQALLIVDSLVAATNLDDENAAAARKPLDVLGQVSELTGCVVLVIHHSKKDRTNGRTSARGSSAITDAVSVHITYERDDKAGAGAPVELKLEKVRHIMPAKSFALQPDGVRIAYDGSGRLRQLDGAKEETAYAAAKRRFAEGFEGTTNELQEAIEKRRQDTQDAVRKLLDERVIVREGSMLRLAGVVQ